MESVYLLLWLADIAGNVGVVGVFAGFALAAIAAVVGVAAALGEVKVEDVRSKQLTRVVGYLAVVVSVAALTPKSKTLQVMAAAKAADVAVTTPLGSKAMKALDAVLDRAIESVGK